MIFLVFLGVLLDCCLVLGLFCCGGSGVGWVWLCAAPAPYRAVSAGTECKALGFKSCPFREGWGF